MTERPGTSTGSTAAGFGGDEVGDGSRHRGTTSNHQPEAPTRGRQAADAAKEQAGQVADTAKQQATSVVGTAQEQAGNVLGEAKDQAVDLFADLKTQLSEQSDEVRDRLAQFLAGVGTELGDMAGAGGGSGYATQLVRQVGDRASSWGSHLTNHDSGDLLDQTRALARRKPGAFLLGAVLAGVVAGRVTRGAKAHHDEAAAPDEPTVAVRGSDRTPVGTAPSTTSWSGAPGSAASDAEGIVARTRPTDPYRDVAPPAGFVNPSNPGEYRP